MSSVDFTVEEMWNKPVFAKDILSLVQQIQLTPDKIDGVKDVVLQDLKKASSVNYSPQVYGSFVSTLADVISDVDLAYIYSDSNPLYRSEAIEVLENVYKNLRKSEYFEVHHFLKEATTPLIKLRHTVTRRECDISCQDEICLWTSRLMNFYVGLDANIKPLVLFIKYILEKYELRGTGKFTTSVIFWLVIFMMQKNLHLPSVRDVSKAAVTTKLISGSNCSVPENYYGFRLQNSNDSVYQWFRTFLKFYGSFSFSQYIICPYYAKEFSVFNYSSHSMFRNSTGVFQCKQMNIQSPFKSTANVGKAIRFEEVRFFKSVCNKLYVDLRLDGQSIFELLPNTLDQKSAGELFNHPAAYAPFIRNL